MRGHQKGFTYLLALFALGSAGVLAVKAAPIIETYERREKEAELIFIGQQFRQAIGSYYQSTPGTIKRYPSTLEDLLIDNRFVGIKRHLRRIYTDPITRQAHWGIVRGVDGGIAGVYSLNEGLPLKQGGFAVIDSGMGGAQSYKDWKFIYAPKQNQEKPNQ